MKYAGKKHAKYSVTTLSEHYIISQDWEGNRYRGMTLYWDYKKHEVHITILDCVAEEVVLFQHNFPNKPQDEPHPHINTKYVTKVKYAEEKYSPPPPGKI